jgi:hypothetical protein
MEATTEIEATKPHLSSFSSNFHPIQAHPGAFYPQQPTTFTKEYEPNQARMNFDQFHQGFPQQNFPFYQFNQSDMMFDPFLAKKYRFINETFPRAKNYKSEASIVEALPHLKDINESKFSLEEITPDAKFFFMRSSNDDDIHKAIKYEKWSSTGPCNTKLSTAYTQYKESRPDEEPQVFFIYSVVNTKNLLGVARVSSNYNIDDTFTYWLEGDKYKGSFKIKWLFVKDVPFGKVEDSNPDGFNLKSLKDGSELPLDVGKSILQAFMKQEARPNIFDIFEYMDRREDVVRHMRDNDFQIHSPMNRKPYRGGRFLAQGKMNYFNNRFYQNNMNTNGNSSTSTNGASTETRMNFQNNNFRQNQYYNKTDGAFRTNSRPYYNNQNNYQSNNGSSNEEGYQKPQDIASVFIIKDTKRQGQQKNRQGQKKRQNNNVNNTNTNTAGANGVSHPNKSKDDKIDDEFWNARPKMSSRDIAVSDDEDSSEDPKFVNNPEPLKQ